MIRHRRVALAAALATMGVVLSVLIAWPGHAPQVLSVGGATALAAAGVAVVMTERRNPYFRSRDEVERVLNVRVLATVDGEK